MWLGNAVTSSTLHADPPSNETIDIFYIKNLPHEKCVLIFSTALIWNFSLTQEEFQPLPQIHPRLHVNCLLFFQTLIKFSLQILIKIPIKSFSKTRPGGWGASCCIRTDRHMDGKTCRHITKRTVALRNFANASKSWRFQFSLLREPFTYFCWPVYCYLPMWRRIIFALCTKWLRNNETAVNINGLTCYHLFPLIVLPLNGALYPAKQRKWINASSSHRIYCRPRYVITQLFTLHKSDLLACSLHTRKLRGFWVIAPTFTRTLSIAIKILDTVH